MVGREAQRVGSMPRIIDVGEYSDESDESDDDGGEKNSKPEADASRNTGVRNELQVGSGDADTRSSLEEEIGMGTVGNSEDGDEDTVFVGEQLEELERSYSVVGLAAVGDQTAVGAKRDAEISMAKVGGQGRK